MMIGLVEDGRGLTDGELAGLRRFVDDKGLGAAAAALELTKESLARLLAKLPVKRETVAAVRGRFEKVGIHVDVE
jgi:hypothetical protein